jgi:CCR4-NOT transcription complex subunit 9
MYFYPNNQSQVNNSQLSKASQMYQPNGNGGYDMMGGGMMGGNQADWSSSNSRKLDRKSTVFIPGMQAGGGGQQEGGPNHGSQKKASGNNSAGSQAMGNQRTPQNLQPSDNLASQEQWRKMAPPNGNRPAPVYTDMGAGMDPMAHQTIDPRMQPRASPELEKICQYIIMLRDPNKKYEYFKELNNKRDDFPQLAPILWYSTGTVAILLQEIINIYPNLSPPTLTQIHSERICNVLGLFQCIALHAQTKPLFIQANLHLYLYPLINKIIKQRPFEHLRVTSLGVIGALVKGEDPETISYLINTELIVLCLRIMKKGNELSRTVATFIVQKILMDESGLLYVCQTEERLLALAQILKDIIEDIARDAKSDKDGKDGQRLLRHIIRCLLRLSENPNANERLAEYIPDCIRSQNNTVIKDDQVRKWYLSLLKNLRLM